MYQVIKSIKLWQNLAYHLIADVSFKKQNTGIISCCLSGIKEQLC